MSSTGDILRKKIRPRAAALGPSVAWWQAACDRVFRKLCKATFALDVKLTGVQGRQTAAPQALDDMPEIALPFLLDAKGNRAGLFVLDGALIDGLIEQQLLGEILPTERLDRPITSVDAGLSEGFVKAALAGIAAEAPGQLVDLTVQGTEQDRAALRLALGEGSYDILEAQIDMGPGIKTGRFELWVPSLPKPNARKAAAQPNPDMIALLQDCEVMIEARLTECVAGAQQLMELKVGSMLSLSKDALTKVKLLDSSGKLFGRGRLGQLDGVRAVRLSELNHIKSAQSTPAMPAAQADPSLTAEVDPAQIGAAPDSVPEAEAEPEPTESTREG